MTSRKADKTIVVEERRLRAVFLPALLVAAGFPLAVACGTLADDGAPAASSLEQNGDAAAERGAPMAKMRMMPKPTYAPASAERTKYPVGDSRR